MRSSEKNAPSRKSLAGKVVVITGASSGAGRATAIEFAKQGAHLVLAARRIEVLHELAAECETWGGTAVAVQSDVTDYASVVNLVKQALQFHQRIDVWVNNAGVLAAGGFTDTPIEVHEQVIRTNLMGYIHGAHAVIPVFKIQRAGILINNISIAGFYPTPYAVGYSASKFGLKGFAEALQGELHGWPAIHVCNLYPAFLDTPGIGHAANYTGVLLKPAPPVYDPRKVARAAVRMALHPKKSTMIGAASYALKIGYLIMPALMRQMTAKVMETYFLHAEPSPMSSGNVFQPLPFGTSIDGTGEGKTGKKTMATAVAAGILITTIALFTSRKKKFR
ncbi:MAG: SDR family oxidoreductase [Chitinophagaceae bacterium]